jgi:hypothetical protein
MKKTTRAFVRKSEIADHVPVNWRRRVKVQAIKSELATRVIQGNTTTVEKEFSEIFDMPHPENSQPYREPWQIFGEDRDNGRIGTEQSASLESLSSRIPGTLVIDPLLRQAAEERGMHASDSATWFLTVAVREYAKNILKGSILYSKAMDTGELHPQILRYPNVLALNSKKDGKPRSETAPPTIHDGKKRLITALDVYSASRSLPSAHINATGGAISRLSLELSFHSAFSSLPLFLPGRQFKDVQNFLSDQIFDLRITANPVLSKNISERSPESNPATSESKVGKSVIDPKANVAPINPQHTSADGASRPMTGTSTDQLSPNFTSQIGRPSLDQVPAPATGARGVKSESISPGLTLKPKEVVVADKSVVGNVANVNASQTGQNLVAGTGRGGKNLIAIMTHVTDSRKDESAVTSSGDLSREQDQERSVSTTTAVPSTNHDNTMHMGNHIGSVSTVKDNDPSSLPGVDGKGDAVLPTQSLKSVLGQQSETSVGAESDKTSTGTGSGGRGKGFGTKNLAAMLARSQTGTPVDKSTES